MKKRFFIYTVICLIFAVFFLAAAFESSAQPSRREVLEKGQKVEELIKVNKEQGLDVSAAVQKYQEARTAYRSKNLSGAEKLLDETLNILQSKTASKPQVAEQPDNMPHVEKPVVLSLNLNKAFIVKINPKYKKGKDISDIKDAIEVTPVHAKDGKITISLSSQPVFILEEKPALPLRNVKPSEDSPFGFHPAKSDDSKNPFAYAFDIGVSWHRPSRYFIWPMVQKNIRKKEYDWSYYDNEVKQSAGLNILYNIIVAQPLTEKTKEIGKRAKRMGLDLSDYIKKNSYMPVDEKAYGDFVTACVERYDGDGIDDMPGLPKPVKYWQIGNEPHPKINDFAAFVKITSVAIKKADPSARIVIGGALRAVMEEKSYFDRSFLEILKGLKGRHIDIVDFHWGGDARGNYRGYKEIYEHLKNELQKIGFSKDVQIWITEISTYSGDPVKLSFQPNDPQYQSEQMQAWDVIKRYAFGLSIGVKKIFWAWGMTEGFKNNDSYFDHTGFIYDGKFSYDEGKDVKKLAYYSYKLMTAILDGSDWNAIDTVIDGKDNLYVYKFKKKSNNQKAYVVWWDYFKE